MSLPGAPSPLLQVVHHCQAPIASPGPPLAALLLRARLAQQPGLDRRPFRQAQCCKKFVRSTNSVWVGRDGARAGKPSARGGERPASRPARLSRAGEHLCSALQRCRQPMDGLLAPPPLPPPLGRGAARHCHTSDRSRPCASGPTSSCRLGLCCRHAVLLPAPHWPSLRALPSSRRHTFAWTAGCDAS